MTESARTDAAPEAEGPRPVTVDEAIVVAIECIQRDSMAEAEKLLRAVIAVVPDHADAQHYLGVLAHSAGHTDEGLALIRRSLQLCPDQADWHSNLGIVLQATDDLDGALAAFDRAIELRPDHPNAHSNRGVLLRVFDRYEEAEAAYRKAIELNPDHANTYHNLAILLDLMRRPEEAVVAYMKALTLRPVFPEARRALVLAYCAIGDRAKATEICEQWVAESPDNPLARHAMAAVSERDVPRRAPDDYVQVVFDSFAETFEAKLAKLHYSAPGLVAGSAAAARPAPDRSLDVLDAGCGTGLCGPLLAPFARRLTGVDLSSGMLEHARAKNVYDRLQQGELTAFIASQPAAFDIIVSADTLVYFGALEEVAAAAAAALRPGGLFVFTLEEWVAAEQDSTYCIRPHGRYNHYAGYVERTLAAQGLRVHIDRGELRKEQGLPVAGLIVRAEKPVVAATAADTVAASRLAGDHNG